MCATVKVPKDWHDVDVKDTWDVELSHVENRDPSHSRYKGTIFLNPGGPGSSGLGLPTMVGDRTPDLQPYYNYLGFEPRGIKSDMWSEVGRVNTPIRPALIGGRRSSRSARRVVPTRIS